MPRKPRKAGQNFADTRTYPRMGMYVVREMTRSRAITLIESNLRIVWTSLGLKPDLILDFAAGDTGPAFLCARRRRAFE